MFVCVCVPDAKTDTCERSDRSEGKAARESQEREGEMVTRAQISESKRGDLHESCKSNCLSVYFESPFALTIFAARQPPPSTNTRCKQASY